MPSISILVPTHNRSEVLARTLACIERLEVPEGVRAELIVVANNCTDDTVARSQEVIDRLGFPGRVVEEAEPGLNPARSRAVREASGEVCALIDDDVAFEPSWLAEIAEFFAESPADIAGGRVRLWWEAVERPEWFTPTLDQLLSATDRGDEAVELKNSLGVIGANFWFRKVVWETVGDFRRDLDRCGSRTLGAGESEFVERGLRGGFRVFYTPRGAVQHWVAPGRIEPAYLYRVAEGNARGRMRMMPPMSLRAWSRSVLGNLYFCVRSALLAAGTHATRGPDAAVHYWARSRKGWGAMRGILDRIAHRPDALKQTEA